MANPTDYSLPHTVNPDLQEFIRENNGLGWGGDTPAYGTTPAGLVPARTDLSTGSYDKVIYSDGSTGPAYYYYASGQCRTIGGGNQLSASNRTAGDFNGDCARNINDADQLVAAYRAPRTWQQARPPYGCAGGATGGMAVDNAIPEVIGDFNADGDLSKEDLRYFMDGLATAGGMLDRKQGAIAIDIALAARGVALPCARCHSVWCSTGPSRRVTTP